MATQGSVNTMSEVLDKLYNLLTQAKTVMDADMPFLIQMETMVLQKLRDPQRKMQEQGLLPPDSAGGPQQQAVPPGGGGPSFGPPGGGDSAMAGMRGMTPGMGAPNADELRRLLSAG